VSAEAVAPPLPAPADAGWETAWAAALTELELAADEAERLLASAHLPGTGEVARTAVWRPPQGLGPLPASLHVRAQALIGRQLDVAQRTAEAMRLSRRHLRAVATMRARPAAVPVYLDAEG
jgi:hypothetical protein